MNNTKKAIIGFALSALSIIGIIGFQGFQKDKDPLQELLGELFIEENITLTADFFTNKTSLDRSLIDSYTGPESDAIKACIESSPQTASEGIVYASVDEAELIKLIQEKEAGTFNRTDVRNTILPVLGHAYINSQINWDWIPETRSYEFYMTQGQEPFWDCYFDLSSETEFFPRFFQETSYKIIVSDTPIISSITEDTGLNSSDGITKDNTLIISGTGTPNTIITVYLDSIALGTIDSDSSGNYSFNYTETTLADKTYSATATAKIGMNGTESQHSTPFSITVDTQTDIPTVNTPTSGNPISGTAEPGATILVTTTSGATCTTTVNTAGNWNCVLSPSPEDGEDVTVNATDPAGNTESTTITNAIENDITPPPVPNGPADLIDESDTGTDNKDNITNETLPTFETYCTETGNIITLYVDGAQAGTGSCTSDIDEPHITLISPLADGEYTIEYTETDSTGNQSGKSPVLNILVDTTPPTQTPELLSPNAPTSNLNAALVGKCGTDAEGGKAEITTDPANGFTPYPATLEPLDGNGNFEISGLTWTQGTYDIVINCFDKAGNGPTTTTTGPVIIDSSAPTSPNNAPDLINSSDTGTDNQDNVTADNTPTFSIKCDEENVTVTLYHHSTVAGTGTCGNAGTSIEIQSTMTLPDGEHPISYTYTDGQGNESGSSPILPIVVDTTSPVENPTLISPVVPTNNETAPIVGTCGQDAANGTVTVSSTAANGFTTNEGTTSLYPATDILLDGLGNFNIPVTWNEGEWMITVSCYDKAGNGPTTQEQGPVVIDITPPDITGVMPDLQTASDTGSNNTDNITADTTPIFDVLCVESDSVITLYIQGVELPITQDCSNAGDTVSFTTPNSLVDGDYDITHTETDSVGNISDFSTGITVTIDTTIPTVNITEPTDSNTIFGTTEPGATVVLTTPSGATCTVIADNAGNWSCTLAPDAISGETVTATATDPAGNTTTDTAVLNTCTPSVYGSAILGTSLYGETCSGSYSPSGMNDSAETLDNIAVVIPVLANDLDSDGDTLSITNLTSPQNGSVSLTGTSVTYTPSTDFVGIDTFTYTPNDGVGDGNITTVTVTVESSCPANVYDTATFDSCNVFEH